MPRAINYEDHAVGQYVDSKGTHSFYLGSSPKTTSVQTSLPIKYGKYDVTVTSIDDCDDISGWYTPNPNPSGVRQGFGCLQVYDIHPEKRKVHPWLYDRIGAATVSQLAVEPAPVRGV